MFILKFLLFSFNGCNNNLIAYLIPIWQVEHKTINLFKIIYHNHFGSEFFFFPFLGKIAFTLIIVIGLAIQID